MPKMKTIVPPPALVVPVALLTLLLAGAAAQADAAPGGKGAVAGTVRMPDGSAASGVVVRLVERDASGRGAGVKKARPPKKGKAKGAARQQGLKATTSGDGSFTLGDVPAGSYAIQSAIKGEAAARQFVTVRPGEVSRVTLSLAKGGGGKRGVGKGDPDGRRPKPAARKAAKARRNAGGRPAGAEAILPA